MTLYGLDIIIAKNDDFYVNEINGVNSGMKGFRDIYGDNRVEEEVFRRLEEKQGLITVNNGTYAWHQYLRVHPISARIAKLRSRFQKYNPIRGVLASPKALVSWMSEDVKYSGDLNLPFPIYQGQESFVFNLVNSRIVPHPQINPYVNEAIAENKFLQYRLLRKTSLASHIPKTALVGLGATDEKTLAEILDESWHVVIKPILGIQGRGVKIITGKRAREFQQTRGPVWDSVNPLYIEDLVEDDNLLFEPGLAIIQPFISSKRKIDSKEAYSVVRAIVCNGHFVDAYLRVSPRKRVNLSQGAKAHPLSDKREIGDFSERVIAIFERECRKLDQDKFRLNLYNAYFDERGRTTDLEREVDCGNLAFRLLYSSLAEFNKTVEKV